LKWIFGSLLCLLHIINVRISRFESFLTSIPFVLLLCMSRPRPQTLQHSNKWDLQRDMAERASVVNASAMPSAFGAPLLAMVKSDPIVKKLCHGSFLEKSVAPTSSTLHSPFIFHFASSFRFFYIFIYGSLATVPVPLPDAVDVPQALLRQRMSQVRSQVVLTQQLDASLQGTAARWALPVLAATLQNPQVEVADLNFADLRIGGSVYAAKPRSQQS